MEAFAVAGRIEKINDALEAAQLKLESVVRSNRFAKASAAYDGAVEQAIHQLQQGLHEKYGKIPTTLAKDMAKGLSKDRLADRISADLEIKVLFSRLKSLEAALTGWQSVNKYLDKMAK